MRISIFKLAAYYLYQVIATDASKEDKKAKDRDTESPNPENTDCNNNVTYMIDKNLSKKPVPFASSDFRNWAKDHNLMILQETYTLVNPGKVAETPGSVLEGLDKAANAPGKADVENLYLPKPDFDYTEGYGHGPKSKESKNKKADSKKDDDKKKSRDNSGEGDKDKAKDKSANDQKNPEQKGANDQKNPEQKGANEQKQQPSQQQSGGAQKKRKSPDSSSSSSSDDDMKEAGPGGQNKKAKKSKLKAGFLSDDSFLKGSSWKSSFLKSNI